MKSNALIEARYRLSLQESHVILWLLTRIKPEDEDFKPHTMKIIEFSKMIGVEADNQYSKLRQVTKSLMKRVLEIYDPEKKEWLQVAWLSSARYQQAKGKVILQFDPALKPYLLQLKSHFTKIDLVDTLNLKSIYAVRIFELLVQYAPIGKREISIDDLRTYCGIEEKEYKDYFDLKRKVINRAKTEINAKTEYEVDYKELKESRKVVGTDWTIKNTKQPIAKESNDKKSYAQQTVDCAKQLPTLSKEEAVERGKDEKGKKIIGALYETLGEIVYNTWFHNNEFVPKCLKNGKPSFNIKTDFARERINTLHSDSLQKAFESAYCI